VKPSKPLIAGLLVVAVVLGALGIVGVMKANAIRGDAAAHNLALVDASATSEVEGQVSTALTRVLSYDYRRPDETQSAADEYLTGEAKGQYDTLFAALQDKAPGQQLVLEARTVVAGVKTLSADQAELLVFIDQSTTRASDNAASFAAAQLAVSAVKEDGAWRISALNPI
jgi:Mce-associated membrane protein